MVKKFSTVWNTERGSQSYMEKRRGKREIEVTRRKRGGIKRGETSLASNKFPKFSPQPGTPREIHRVKERRERGGGEGFTVLRREEKGEGGDRGDLGEKKESQKGIEQSSQ